MLALQKFLDGREGNNKKEPPTAITQSGVGRGLVSAKEVETAPIFRPLWVGGKGGQARRRRRVQRPVRRRALRVVVSGTATVARLTRPVPPTVPREVVAPVARLTV